MVLGVSFLRIRLKIRRRPGLRQGTIWKRLEGFAVVCRRCLVWQSVYHAKVRSAPKAAHDQIALKRC